MALGAVIPLAIQIATDEENRVVAGALAYFTAAGTPAPFAVYADPDLTIPLSDPVVASGAGRFPVMFSPVGVAYNLDIRTPAGESLPGYPVVNVSSGAPEVLSGGPVAPELLYPVGSIYMNGTVSTNPATLLGFGVWTAFGRGRVLIGIDTAQAEFDTAGETGGEKTHTLSAAEMPAHTHVQNAHGHTQDAHSHLQDAHTHAQNSHNHTQDAHKHTISDPGHGHNIYDDTADGGSHVGVQPYAFTNTIAASGIRPNTTGVDMSTNAATNQAATATNQNATATNQATAATNQAATATNQDTGGDGAHNNLPPYLVVYMWLRTA